MSYIWLSLAILEISCKSQAAIWEGELELKQLFQK